MKIGIIGLPFVGKTTIFNLLCNLDKDNAAHNPGDSRVVRVHDERIDILSKMYNPKKTIYADIQFTDTSALDPKAGSKERNRVFSMIQKSDALLWVIGFFEDCVDSPLSQLEDIKSEIILHDLEIVENRIEKLEGAKRKLDKNEEEELELLKKFHSFLDESKFPNLEELDENYKKYSSLNLFSIMPSVVLLNSDEDRYSEKSEIKQKIKNFSEENKMALVEICGKFEMELNDLNEEEKKEFMSELGITESGIQKLSKIVYNHIGLISFFTVGEDEVRAWTIKKETCAKEAAGKIHTDLERGFIRAEIMKYTDLITHKNEKELKEKGLFHVVGKEHIIQDGDIMNVRFNV